MIFCQAFTFCKEHVQNHKVFRWKQVLYLLPGFSEIFTVYQWMSTKSLHYIIGASCVCISFVMKSFNISEINWKVAVTFTSENLLAKIYIKTLVHTQGHFTYGAIIHCSCVCYNTQFYGFWIPFCLRQFTWRMLLCQPCYYDDICFRSHHFVLLFRIL